MYVTCNQRAIGWVIRDKAAVSNLSKVQNNRIIIGHERKDLGEIKLEYSKIYDETLDETIENRVDIEEIKKLFLMIITTGRHATSSNCRNIDLDHKIQNRSSGQGTSPITTKLRKKFSHDALDKLSHVF
ncbi:unnamed protein product [Rotaria socialis]